MESALAVDPAAEINRERCHQPGLSEELGNRPLGSVQPTRRDLSARGMPRGSYPSNPGRRAPDPEDFFTSARPAHIPTSPSLASEQVHGTADLSTLYRPSLEEARDSSIHPTPHTHVMCHYTYLAEPAQDVLGFDGNDPAGLVFRDIAGPNVFQYSASSVADAPPFLNADSFALNNLWSVCGWTMDDSREFLLKIALYFRYVIQ